jgi:hypothetical protein
MENRVSFDLRIAAHQDQVARINAEDWKRQAGHGPLGRLRAALASLLAFGPGQSTPQPRPIGGATA